MQDAQREQRQAAADEPAVHFPKRASPGATADFYARQQALIDRKRALLLQKEQGERQRQADAASYVAANCNYKAASHRPPSNLNDRLLLIGQDERNELAEKLIAGDQGPDTQKLLQLGNGVPLTTAYLQDSIATHVGAVRKATEERRRRFEMLKLRD